MHRRTNNFEKPWTRLLTLKMLAFRQGFLT